MRLGLGMGIWRGGIRRIILSEEIKQLFLVLIDFSDLKRLIYF